IAMNEAHPVEVGEGQRELQEDAQGRSHRERRRAADLLEVAVEGLSLDELHRVPRAPGVDALLQDLHHPWVPHPAERVDLSSNRGDGARVMHADRLERHGVRRTIYPRAVDEAHPPMAEQLDDPVAPEAARARRAFARDPSSFAI